MAVIANPSANLKKKWRPYLQKRTPGFCGFNGTLARLNWFGS